MSRVPMGKLLLRNVIRHTDAHNKIQEESEMWKLRNLERQSSSTHAPNNRGQMHCDRYLDSEGPMQSRLGDRLSDRDEKEAKYWTRKLYEFEASDPDRWGHSGFKELYPEEFHSDGEQDCSGGKHREKKRKIALKADIKKPPKKSSKKKKKKEKKKKRTVGSDSESCSDAEDSGRRKKAGKNKRRKKKHKSKERPEDSSTEDSHSEKRQKTRRKRDGVETDTSTEPQTKKRKNWRVAKDERSEESSDG